MDDKSMNSRVPLGPSSIENDAHGIEKLLLKTQVSEKFLHSEVNLILQLKSHLRRN